MTDTTVIDREIETPIEEPKTADKVEDLKLPEEPKIEAKFNPAREAASLIPVGSGGVDLQNLANMVDFAKHMAASNWAVPKHLRGNVGACLSILDTALIFGFSPWQVARMTYVVNDMIAYQAQLVTGIINKRAPIRGRLRYAFHGEGEDRLCVVSAIPKGETEQLDYTSPKVKDIQPKNSPLWKTDPDQQLSYLSASRFCRRHFSDIIMGIYSDDEIEDAYGTRHIGADRARDVTPLAPLAGLHDRITEGGEGWTDTAVEDGLANLAINQDIPEPPPEAKRRRKKDEE